MEVIPLPGPFFMMTFLRREGAVRMRLLVSVLRNNIRGPNNCKYTLNTYYVPGTTYPPFTVVAHLILKIIPEGRYCWHTIHLTKMKLKNSKAK